MTDDSKSKYEFAYKTTLKKTYGLTDSWIKRLGEPDKVVPNPHYRNGPPSSLYRRTRVEEFIEANQEEYDKLQAKRAKLRAASQRVADKKRQETLSWAESVGIELLEDKLPKTYNGLCRACEEKFLTFIPFSADFSLTNNAIVAYIRHNFTNYEALLSQAEGRTGVGEAYWVIKARVNETVKKMLEVRYGVET